MNYELNAYLETIEPELRVLTRLFGFPESVWDEPKKFVPLAEELEQRDGVHTSSSPSKRTAIGRSVPPPRRTTRMNASVPCTAGGPPAGSASRRCMTSCGR